MTEVKTLTMTQYRELVKSKPVRRKPVQRESQLQQSAVLWFRRQYPQYAQLLFSIPNGGHRNKITASRMKAEGQVKGALDLLLAVTTESYPGLFIEMKYGRGRLSPEQNEMIDLLYQQGYDVQVCYSLEEFMKSVNAYLS